MNTDIKTEKAFFAELGKKSREEMKLLFDNLKHIGFNEEKIEALTEEYYSFFQKLEADKAIVRVEEGSETEK
jgi:hypothetical protein